MRPHNTALLLLLIAATGCSDATSSPATPFDINPTQPRLVSLHLTRTNLCAHFTNGTIHCAGSNSFGALGDGSDVNFRSSPVPVKGLSDVKAFSPSTQHHCAHRRDGSLACWGLGFMGQLGHGKNENMNTPVRVQNISTVDNIHYRSNYSCVSDTQNITYCWGELQPPCRGCNKNPASINTPEAIEHLPPVRTIKTMSGETCAVLTDDTLRCWETTAKKLGTSTFNTTHLKNINTLHMHGDSACALLNDGTVSCWGKTRTGMVSARQTILTATTVEGLSNVRSLSSNYNHTCAILNSGRVKCWGSNYSGQLGDDTLTSSETPVDVLDLQKVESLHINHQLNCAILQDKTVKCWGYGKSGRLGNGDTVSTPRPTPVLNLSNVKTIKHGSEHTCALSFDGTVKCWGRNDFGQLGDGTLEHRSVATPVKTLSNVTELIVNDKSNCARLKDDSVKCWGYNYSGLLGVGTTENEPTPRRVMFEH